jgi:hypothetical protein
MFTASNKALFGRCAAEPSKFGVQPHDLADRPDRRRPDPRRRSICRGLNQRADHDPLFRARRFADDPDWLRRVAAGIDQPPCNPRQTAGWSPRIATPPVPRWPKLRTN